MHCSKINHSRALMSAIPLFLNVLLYTVVCTLVFVRRSTGRRLIATCVVYSSVVTSSFGVARGPPTPEARQLAECELCISCTL